MLATSGHIAGVVNPPESGKYNHFTSDSMPDTPDEWLAGAVEVSGSWWPDWNRWVTSFDVAEVPARVPGKGRLKVLEAAPGSYVAMRI